MRKLSEEEKAFVKELVSISKLSYDVFLSNIIDRELIDVEVYLNYENKVVEYRFDEDLYNKNPHSFHYYARDFSWKIIRYVNLLKDLEKEGMLFLYQEGSDDKELSFGQLNKEKRSISSEIKDAKSIELIIEFTKKTILTNQSLFDFEENGFLTIEDQKHKESIDISKENLRVADESLKSSLYSLELSTKSLSAGNRALIFSRYTLISTILIFVLGTILNLIISYQEPEPFRIDEMQLELINKTIQNSNQSLIQKIDVINNNLVKIDSLVINVDNELKGVHKSIGSSNRSTLKHIRQIETKLMLIDSTIYYLKEDIK